MRLSECTPVVFINVTDRELALAFYRDTLGLELCSTDEFGDFFELGHALLRITAMPDHLPHGHPVAGWNVDDLPLAVQSLRKQNIEFTIYEGMGQDEFGIWTSPDGQAQVAFFLDPHGNVLSLSKA